MASALPLVDYSDSDSDAAQPPAKIQKTTSKETRSVPLPKLPPLPSRFHELYVVPPRVGKEDDPSLHGGRKRSTPHVQGNWPTHVFVEWHLTRAEFDSLDNFYTSAAKAAGGALAEPLQLESHLKSDLGSELPLHLSLSRPNVLRTEQREGFLETLKERYRKARVKPFTVEFTGFEWVGNYDSTRWFLVLKAARRSSDKLQLPRLLDLTNRTFAAFKQPALYTKNGNVTTGFHVSLAWSLTKPTAEIEKNVRSVLAIKGDRVTLNGGSTPIKMQVDNIKVKIGSTFHVVELGIPLDTPEEEATLSRKRRMS
ncbi:U6 snRNA phosphodiesterase Usb1 [Geopyxis carbonaria]|nr:U6 snRNA phosphodiesterase Usb1 [Geopyxis carbonaria]